MLKEFSFAHSSNFRDVGACESQEGKRLRAGMVFRSGSPHRLSDQDRDELYEAGLRVIIDLRSSQEIELTPNPFALDTRFSWRHIHVKPLYPPGEEPQGEARLDLRLAYRAYLERAQENLREVFETLATPEGLPCLVHCTAGKDRTGVVVALLLDLLRVDRADIMADYSATKASQSEEYFQEAAGRAALAGFEWSDYQKLLVCPPEIMAEFLEYLEAVHGGARAYLEGIGVSRGALNSLEKRMLK